MKAKTKGTLKWGGIPRVVGTVCTRAGLEDFVARYRGKCDIAEARLDLTGLFRGWEDACRRIEESGTPVIATLRTTREGGKCSRPRGERLRILTRAVACASLVDVELRGGLSGRLRPKADAAGCSLIVSYHNFRETPPKEVIDQVIREGAKDASLVKVATLVRSRSDIGVLKEVLARTAGIPLCLIGMGPMGTVTRTTFATLGSRLTFGYLDLSAAPGQLSAEALVRYLRGADRGYAADFASRHALR